MTVEEAKALVLCEGMMTEPVPDGIMPTILHEGALPTSEHFSSLIEAIDIVHTSIEDDAMIDRKLAGALWIIGVEANSAMGNERQSAAQDNLIALMTTVESALMGFWTVGHLRDKKGVKEAP